MDVGCLLPSPSTLTTQIASLGAAAACLSTFPYHTCNGPIVSQSYTHTPPPPPIKSCAPRCQSLTRNTVHSCGHRTQIKVAVQPVLVLKCPDLPRDNLWLSGLPDAMLAAIKGCKLDSIEVYASVSD